jgi:hypothetical protein
MCCASNRSNPSGGFLSNGRTSDTCMENGLCKNVARDYDDNYNTVVITEYWRDLCTSSEWPEANCVDVCSQGDVSCFSDTFIHILYCMSCCMTS